MDKIDEEILGILEKDARSSVTDVATMLDLDEEEASERIESMEENGVIRGYKAVIDYEKAVSDHVSAYIDLDIELKREAGYDEITERIAKFEEVESLQLVSGSTDLRLKVTGKNMKELAFFVADKISTLEQVRDTVTSFVLKNYKENGTILEGKEENGRLPITP